MQYAIVAALGSWPSKKKSHGKKNTHFFDFAGKSQKKNLPEKILNLRHETSKTGLGIAFVCAC